jgi:RimJ/RimL family protein N-acetyltransferase
MYKCLTSQNYTDGTYTLVPIRNCDRYKIMQWRNEQIYHLRQKDLLTAAQQDFYFDITIAADFEKEKPLQILFSFLKGEECIGYGGLVHINWKDKYAEISFIINTALEKEYFEHCWTTYLLLIEQVAFNDIGLHKIFTYAFDLRPRLYTAVEAAGFTAEARLKEHCFFDEKFIDVVIHSKINN